jgi:hypothetical protein
LRLWSLTASLDVHRCLSNKEIVRENKTSRRMERALERALEGNNIIKASNKVR